MTLYETGEDLSNEWSDTAEFMLYASAVAEKAYVLHKIDLNGLEPVPDYWIKEEATGEYIAVLEHKRRKYSFYDICKMGGQYIKKGKYDCMMNWVASGYGATLLVRFLDKLCYINLKLPHDIKHGVDGRTDRNDPNDVAEVVYFTNPQNWVTVPTGENNGY